MAQKTTVTVTCDFPHKAKEGEVAGEETLTWSFDGTTWEADVCAVHALEVRTRFKEWAGHGRRATAHRQNGQHPDRRRRRDRASSAAVRSWARQRGHTVSERGRIPVAIQAEYDAAH